MNGGVKSLLVVASLATVGCAAEPGQVKVRPIADPGSKLRPGTDRLADAKGQLALGNVGLALEGFRRASREYPDNAEAFAGMAACYDAMGRYDLAQTNYEAALALAPRNAALLTALAGTLERQGQRAEAAEVRGEVVELNSASAALDQTQPEPAQAAPIAKAAPVVTVALPPPRPATNATFAMPSPRPATNAAFALPPPRPATKATVALPSVRPAGTLTALTALMANDFMVAPPSAQLAPPDTLKIRAPDLSSWAQVSLRSARAPRLERLSPGEVALLTGSGPMWRAQVVARTPQKLTVRWVPLTTASARPNIRLLNAARCQGLAARTRDYLLGRGWRKIEIGDSSDVREKSVVLYPAARQATGRSLAAQFGFQARVAEKGDVFVVLLGRDAAAARLAQRRG